MSLFLAQDTSPDELLSAVMTAVLKDLNLKPELLGDICVGESLGSFSASFWGFSSLAADAFAYFCRLFFK